MRVRLAGVILSVRERVRQRVRGYMKEGHRGEVRSEPYRGGLTDFSARISKAGQSTIFIATPHTPKQGTKVTPDSLIA